MRALRLRILARVSGAPLSLWQGLRAYLLGRFSDLVTSGGSGQVFVFTGTRVPVQNLLDYLAGGGTLDEFLDGFPGVSRGQVVSFLELAKAAPRSRSREF